MAESDRDRLRRRVDEILQAAEEVLEGASREAVRRLLSEVQRLGSRLDFSREVDWAAFDREVAAVWAGIVDDVVVAEISAAVAAGAIGAGMSRPFPPEFRAAAARFVRTQRNRIVIGRAVDGLTLSRQVSERFRDVVEAGLNRGWSTSRIATELDLAFEWDGNRGRNRKRLTLELRVLDADLDDRLSTLGLRNRIEYEDLPGLADPDIDRLVSRRDKVARRLAENRAQSSLVADRDGRPRWGRLEVERPDGTIGTVRADTLDREITAHAKANGITKAQAGDKFVVRRRVTSGWEARATRIARTEATTAYNGGAFEAAQQRERDGRAGSRQWLATIDARTRTAHWNVDGQCRSGGALFDLAGSSARFPGDPNLPAALRINCRCAMLEFDAPGCSAAEDREFKAALERSDAVSAEIERRRAAGEAWGRDD